MIGAGVVPDAEDRVGVIEIFERHRSLADADRVRQPDAGCLVAHVRTVGEIVGAEFAREELIEKRGFVGGPAGSVELRHVRIGKRAQRRADLLERIVPGDGLERVCRVIVDHRVRQAALAFERVIGPLPKFRNRVRGEELRRRAFACRFPRHGLGAVLAEFER